MRTTPTATTVFSFKFQKMPAIALLMPCLVKPVHTGVIGITKERTQENSGAISNLLSSETRGTVWYRAIFMYVAAQEEKAPAQRVADYDDFGGFVRGWLTATNIWSSEVFKPQHYFICDDNLQVQMDFVGRLENIDADFRALCERLNVKSELNCLNASDHRHYSEYYTDDLREKVASIYAKDIATFGYRFEGDGSDGLRRPLFCKQD